VRRVGCHHFLSLAQLFLEFRPVFLGLLVPGDVVDQSKEALDPPICPDFWNVSGLDEPSPKSSRRRSHASC
jgi:hypothetical protein